ncbi:hypothetical protein [Nonomuraea sp. NPDC049400]|uniref:hypothetical protein n=1 Tax=Nonomuraea sp. NPDC049400 TaxID=3364352 RepID=UPI0037A03660
MCRRRSHRLLRLNRNLLEWHGTLVPKDQTDRIRFGIIERVYDTGGISSDWTLTFDQLPLVADEAKIMELYGRLR